MLETIKNIFSVKDIRKKLLFTFLILVLFRLGTFITIPGLDKIALNEQLGAVLKWFNYYDKLNIWWSI